MTAENIRRDQGVDFMVRRKRKLREEREPSASEEAREIPVEGSDEAKGKVSAAASRGQAVAEEEAEAEAENKKDLAAEYLEQLQRVQAEFANYRKRVQREMLEAYDYAKSELVCKLLPVLDDMERAIESLPPDCGNDEAAKGVKLIYDKLKSTLKAEGVEAIECKGKTFDPNFHEAVMVTRVDDGEDCTVVKDFQKGYTYKGKLIRPSKVEVTQLQNDSGE
jgi:molecular chaperone GrpE